MTEELRLEVLEEIQKLLGVEDVDIQDIPKIVQALIQSVRTPPCLVAFAFDPSTGQLRQVSLSAVPRTAEAYHAIAQVTTKVSQQFSDIAMEAAKNVGQAQGMGKPMSAHRGTEPGNGTSRERCREDRQSNGNSGDGPQVGEEAPVVGSDD